MGDLNNTEEMPVLNEQPEKPKKTPKKSYTAWNVVLTILTILVNIAFIVELFYVTKYSALSKGIFIKVNVAALVVLLLVDILVFFSIRLKNLVLMIISTCLLIAGGGTGGYAAYALLRVDKSVNDITKTEYTKSVNTSLVVYSKGSGKPILDVADISGARVGYATGTDTAEVGQKYLSDAGVTPEFKQYNDYTDVFKGLIASEIDVAVLPGSYKSVLSSDEALAPYLEDSSALETFTADVKAQSVAGADKDLTKEPFTVLLTGENEGLADTIMIVTVNPISMKVTMTSIARDSYVPITCYGGGSSKINAAHAVSEACMVDTVEQLTGVDIDYTVEFNFDSVIQVVDAVGGIDVYNEVAYEGLTWSVEYQAEYFIDMPEGDLHLDGVHALAYARERHAFPDGDFARQRHQQEIIQKVLAKVMASKDPNMYLNVLQAAGDNIKTNLSAEQMVGFVSYAMKKANRYYDSSNLASVFDIQTNRITGYSAMMWNDGLEMYLYTYMLYNGSISDSYNAIERNITMSTTPSPLGYAGWSAHDTYTPPAMSQDVYYESGETVIGGPGTSEEETPAATAAPEENIPTPTTPPDTTGGQETPTDPTPAPETPGGGETGGTGTETPGGDAGGSEQTPETPEQSE
mgnify:CR=1 FL=1